MSIITPISTVNCFPSMLCQPHTTLEYLKRKPFFLVQTCAGAVKDGSEPSLHSY